MTIPSTHIPPSRTGATTLAAGLLIACALAWPPAPLRAQLDEVTSLVTAGDRVVIIGNTFAERLQHFPHLEAALVRRFLSEPPTFRNLGWSGDEVALQPRPLGFGAIQDHLAEQSPHVILASFGMNESFAGEAGLPSFRRDLRTMLGVLREPRGPGRMRSRVVLISPIPQERLARIAADVEARNREIARYTVAMREEAVAAGVHFIDLFTPLRPLAEDPQLFDLTINGIHLNDSGYRAASHLLAAALTGQRLPETEELRRTLLGSAARSAAENALLQAIRAKNQLFFHRWRPVNGEYVFGRRKEPFGVKDFPPEMRRLETQIAERERGIAALAARPSASRGIQRGAGR